MNNEQNSTCPTASELKDFAIGNVADAHFEELANHVSVCKQCGNRFDAETNQHTRGLVAELRS